MLTKAIMANKKLTHKETRAYCRAMHAEGNPSEYILGFKMALDKNLIDANVALVELISNGDYEGDLYPIAICLRFGGNSNVYVSSTGLSHHIHILGLVYDVGRTIQDETYMHSLISLMLLDGAILTKRIFDPSFGSIKKVVKLDDGPSVLEWLIDNGYPQIKEIYQKGIENYLSRETLNYLYILLDQPDKIVFGHTTPEHTTMRNLMIIKSLGDNNLVKLVPQAEGILWNSSDLSNSIVYLNLLTFDKVVSAGIKPAYPIINDLLLRATRYRQLNLDIFEKVILEMLNICVTKGIEMDKYQLAMISGLDGEMYKLVTKEYKKPLWRKSCGVQDNEIPLKLKQLATLFDIPIQSKDFVCTRLTELAKRDPVELKSAIKSQKTRQMGSSLGWTEEFIVGNPPTLACSNKLPSPYDEYSSLHISSFREADDSIWCFTADQYESLLETKRNPYGGELPDDYLQQIKFKLDTLKSLGLDPLNTKDYLIDERVKLLTEPDKESVDDFVSIFDQLLERDGVARSKYNKLTNDVIRQKMDDINIVVNVHGLSVDHAKITYAWIMVWLDTHEPSLYRRAINDLNERKKSPS